VGRRRKHSIDKVHAALVKMLGDGLEWKIIIGVISFRLAVIFNRNRKDIDYKKIIKVENVTNKGYDLVIEQEWLMNNPLTLFSLNEEFDGWKKFGVVINLISR
jgi:exopolyphosphatase/pppGpp-phosphohydrolase